MPTRSSFSSAWYAGNRGEQFQFLDREFGPMGWAAGSMLICNVVVPQIFWFKAAPEQPDDVPRCRS